jgi:hypothetical protein
MSWATSKLKLLARTPATKTKERTEVATMNYIDRAGTELQELRAVERAPENIMASDVTKGMEAYDLSGAWVGTVSEIWAHQPNHGYLPRSQTYLNDYGPIAGTSGWFATTDGYIKVTKPVAPVFPSELTSSSKAFPASRVTIFWSTPVAPATGRLTAPIVSMARMSEHVFLRHRQSDSQSDSARYLPERR